MPQDGWSFETLLAHLTAQIETLHHEVEGREDLWRREYDARIDGLRCHADDHWDRLQAQAEETRSAVDREDRNLARRIDDLRTYHDDSVRALERLVSTAMNASEKAVTKSEASMDRRLEALNEFRAVLSDQQRTLIGRDEYMAAHANLVERVDGLQARLDRSEGQGIGKTQMWGYVVAIIAALGTIVVVANVFLDHALA